MTVAKLALGSVKMVFSEKTTAGMSEQDLATRRLFTYYLEDTEARLARWTGDETVKKAVIPATIEGKPVKSLPAGLFMLSPWGVNRQVEEIIISEGIERIEKGSIFWTQNLKKVVFPASVNYISHSHLVFCTYEQAKSLSCLTAYT